MGRKKMFWEEHSSKELPLAFNGVPFFILGGQVRECCHGPDRHRAEKHKAIKQKKAADHDYVQQTRQFVQTTTKMNCPAAIHLRSIVTFPSYRIENDSNWGRRKQVKVLRSDLLDPEKEIFWEHHVFVALPAPGAHRNHLTNEIGCLVHKVDKIVIKKIHSLVADGVRDVAEMRRHVTSFSKTNFPGLPETSNRFYPNNRCLRNHMYAALSLSQLSTEDQENLQQHVNKWRNERPDDHFHFVPSPKEEAFDHEDFIFVHQTAWQKRLLSLYGNEICLLDATYCVCKCDVALFFIAVSTNVGYITAGCFMLPSETVRNISRGLDILKQWNPDWSPAYFMTDYDQKEIVAIESTFPDCFTYLCDFHREQSWERWLKTSTHNIGNQKKELLRKMRDIAHADCEDTFRECVSSLKESQCWLENEHLRAWFEKMWLSEPKRWVKYHRQSLVNVRVSTTNGLERQHYQLKQNYLKKYTEGSVTSLVSTIITQFIPDSLKRYRESNVKCLDTSRMYSDSVPTFLRNRPRIFRDHCTKRLPAAAMITMSDITILGDQKFCVASRESCLSYMLDLSGSLPKCSCPDWKKFHLPCKHMLFVLLNVSDSGWDNLSEEFTNSPHLNIDKGVCNIPVLVKHMPLSSKLESASSSTLPSHACTSPEPQQVHRQHTAALGTRCKMLASSLHSMLHLVQNASDYEHIYNDLMNVHSKVRSMVPKEAGLLRRPRRLGRKPCKHGRLKPRKKRRKAQPKKAEPDITGKGTKRRPRVSIKPMDTSIQIPKTELVDEPEAMDISTDQEGCASELVHEPEAMDTSTDQKSCATELIHEPEVLQTHIQEEEATGSQAADLVYEDEGFENVWNNAVEDTTPILEIGPHRLTKSSFLYLKSCLSDELIDAFMTLQVRDKNVLYIGSINGTAIFEGSPELANFLRMENLTAYEYCVTIINEQHVHWTLMIILPREKTLVYVNPLGENRDLMTKYLQHWYFFLHQRYMQSIDSSQPAMWKITTRKHAKQIDSTSCGVYSLLFAEQYMRGQNFSVRVKRNEIEQYREDIGRRVYSAGAAYRVSDTVTEQVDAQQEDVQITRVEEATETVPKEKKTFRTFGKKVVTNIGTGEIDDQKPQYFLRDRNLVAKVRRDSWIYPNNVCLCKGEVNESVKVQCDGCNKRYHPQCIGLRSNDIPVHVFCTKCVKKVADQLHGKDANITPLSAFFDNWTVILERTLEMLDCEKLDCTLKEHERHHQFLINPEVQCESWRRMYGFGEGAFLQNSIQVITTSLKELLYIVLDERMPATSLPIQMLPTNSPHLGQIFKENKSISVQYLLDVLVKIVLTWTLALHRGIVFPEAWDVNVETEVDMRQILRKKKKFV